MPVTLDGKLVSNTIKEELKLEVAACVASGKRPPHLVAIIVGNDTASQTYVASKEKNSASVGIRSTIKHLASETTTAQLLELVQELNADNEVDGYIIQLPLPAHMDATAILYAINPDKDVDGFHPSNLGKMVLGDETFLPATPMGIMEMLKRYQIATKGKHAVVLGRSNIVGTPISILLSRNSEPGNCTVTLCHSHTPNIKEICRSADILVAAIGKKHFVTADMVKPGAVVVDVGINRAQGETKIYGDVDFENVAPICSYITPVPGGVGLMTIVSLLQNTLHAYKQNLIKTNT